VSKKNAATRDRRARIEEMRRQEALLQHRLKIIILAVTLSVVVLIVGGAVWAVKAGGGGAASQIQGLKNFDGLPRNHVQGSVQYTQTPPVGGNHAPVWQNCGVYSQPIANENGVHSLEHGAVWITYQPNLPAGQVAKIVAAAKNQSYVLISPYPGLPAPVVASAWGKQVTLTGADDPRLTQFIRAFENGPQTPEPGAACIGGTGRPQ
jgi:Protein of unknown function (DUF3105)